MYYFNGKISMKNKHILKLFIAFLKQNEAYNEYLYGLSKGEHYRFNCNKKWISPENFIIETIQRSPSNLILDAFNWETDSNLSQETWWELNDEWEDIMYKKFRL